jgi:DedD protein
MSLFSFLRKKKQESASGESPYYSRAEEESSAVRGRSRRKKGNQNNEAADPVLPEKKRARRRLIGAVALVLAAVIGLPMILDSEPKPLTNDIAIHIPSKDKPAQPASSRQPVAPATPTIAAAASLDPKEEVIEPPTAAASNARTVPQPPEAAPAATAEKSREDAKPTKPVKVTAVEKPTAAPPKTESKPEPKVAKTEKVERADDSARALALLAGKSDAKADSKADAEKKSGKFVIQVAALATKEKVNELQTKLKDAGIKSFTQKVATESGERIRIRVGPFGSKDEADKVRAKIVKLGLNGTIVPA